MSLSRPALVLSSALLAWPLAQAQSTAPAVPAAADTAMQQAQDRLRADQALCEKETTASGRLQCRRDALAAYEESEPKAASTAASPAAAGSSAAAFQAVPGCAECGRITGIRPLNGSGVQETATRGPAGRLLEQRLRAHPRWAVEVQYPNSETALYVFPQEPGFKLGEAVRKDGSGIVRP